MTRGRKAKPTHLKMLQGNAGKRALNKNEPQFDPSDGKPPAILRKKGFKVAKEEWNRLAPQLISNGLLTEGDLQAFAGYCVCYQRWLEAEEKIRTHGLISLSAKGTPVTNPYFRVAQQALQEMKSIMSEFGLTPSSRTKITANPSGEVEDPMEAFLKRGQK